MEIVKASKCKSINYLKTSKYRLTGKKIHNSKQKLNVKNHNACDE